MFDPEKVKSVDPWSYWVNAGDVVKRSDYDKLLELYREVLASFPKKVEDADV